MSNNKFSGSLEIKGMLDFLGVLMTIMDIDLLMHLHACDYCRTLSTEKFKGA